MALTELASARSLAIASNRSLPNGEALAVEERLRAAGFTGTVRVAANDETATCP